MFPLSLSNVSCVHTAIGSNSVMCKLQAHSQRLRVKSYWWDAITQVRMYQSNIISGCPVIKTEDDVEEVMKVSHGEGDGWWSGGKDCGAITKGEG